MRKPTKWYKALVTWLAIYPTITLILLFLDDKLAPVALPLKTMILTVIVVPIMTFVAVPLVNRGLALLKRPDNRLPKNRHQR